MTVVQQWKDSPNYFSGMMDDRYHDLLTGVWGNDNYSMNKRKDIVISVMPMMTFSLPIMRTINL